MLNNALLLCPGELENLLEDIENDCCFLDVSPLATPPMTPKSGQTELDASPTSSTKRSHEEDEESHSSKYSRSSSIEIITTSNRQYNQDWAEGRVTFVIDHDCLYYVLIVACTIHKLTAKILFPIPGTGVFWGTEFFCPLS